jgi:hypothetical protein
MCAQNTFANMTQYRVDARNCEAKRQFVEPYVASKLRYVGMPRQADVPD